MIIVISSDDYIKKTTIIDIKVLQLQAAGSVFFFF